MPRTRRLKGTGSVYRSGEKWTVQVDLGQIDGKRKYKRWTFGTLQEAQRKLRMVQDGAPTAKAPILAAFLTAALEKHAPQLRPRTLRSYQRTLELHISPFIGHVPVNTITPQAIEDWLRTLRLKGRGTATVRYSRVVLRTLLRHAQRSGWLVSNPAALASAPKHRKAEIAPLTPEQATQVLTAVAGHWMEPIVLVAMACGLRLGEVLGLQWTDIDLTAGTLSVRRTLQRVHIPRGPAGQVAANKDVDLHTGTKNTARGPHKTQLQVAETKTASSRRTLILPALVTERLTAHQAEMAPIRSRWVFSTLKGTPLEPRNVNRAWHLLRVKAGLPKLRIHDLRHSAASFALVLGISARAVADMLGHAETRTTLDLYTHVLPSLRDGIAEQLDTLFRTLQPKGRVQ
jgi:integrase